MAITIQDVAKDAQVSISTVSRVLNNHPFVSSEVRVAVKASIEKLGYKPNQIASRAARKSNKFIGVMLPDISNNIFGRILRGIDSVAWLRGYSLIVCDTAMDINKEMHYFNLLKEKRVDGIIFSNAHVTDQHLMWVKRNHRPVVFVCQDPEPPDSFSCSYGVVNIDNRQAVCDMVNVFYNMGHRAIAFLAGPQFDPSAGRKRFEGYKKGLAEQNLPYKESLVYFCDDFTIESGYKTMEHLYQECPALPTAILCACDNIAVGAMEFMQDNNIMIPDQISVAGIDDTEMASVVRPTLTTLRHATFEQGVKAAEMLFDFIHNPEKERVEFRMPYQIIRRQSVKYLHKP